MRADELKSELDRKHCERSEKRHRARSYKDRPIQRKEKPSKQENDDE